MPNSMRSRLYTRTGDDGRTGLRGGLRVTKAHPRVEAYGTLDEVVAILGMARVAAMRDVPELAVPIERCQRGLMRLAAALAAPGTDLWPSEASVEAIEREIDAIDATLEPLSTLVVPGESELEATLHLARAICRRAERRVVALIDEGPLAPAVMPYLNRTSDLLFSLARRCLALQGRTEREWAP